MRDLRSAGEPGVRNGVARSPANPGLGMVSPDPGLGMVSPDPWCPPIPKPADGLFDCEPRCVVTAVAGNG